MAGAPYEITSVNQTQRLNADGHLADYVDVTFTTADGQGSGSVEVPLQAGWEDAANAKIQPIADQITAYIGTTG